MTYAHVVTAKTSGQNGGTSGSVDTTGANFLVVLISKLNGVTVTVSDSKSNTWTGLTLQSGNQPNAQLFYVSGVPTVGSGHTFTIAGTNSFSLGIFSAFSGSDTAGQFDQQSGAAGAGSPPGSITPSADNMLVIAGAAADGTGVSGNQPSGYTQLDAADTVGGASYGGATAYQIQTTATATNPTWSFGFQGCVVAASFKASAGGGGGATSLLVPSLSGWQRHQLNR